MALKDGTVTRRASLMTAPVRVRLSIVSLSLPSDAPPVAQYAADELARLLKLLFGLAVNRRRPADDPFDGSSDTLDLTLALATPSSNLDALLARFDQPSLAEQEYLILPVHPRNDQHGGSILIAGGSPAALLWGVYELAEFWGMRFHIGGERLASSACRAIALPKAPIRRKPMIALRAWRGINQLPHSGAYWGLRDYRLLIDQLAKLRFNCFYAMLPPYGPFADFEWRGLRKRTAELDFGWRFPVDPLTIGREKFDGSAWYENPDIPYDSSYDQKIAAASRLLDDIRGHARARGMKFCVRFTFTEFPEEFKEHLRKLSLEDGFVPDEPDAGGYVYRIGISREGLDPTYSPFMSVRNRCFVDLVATQLRAYLERFGDADYLVLHPPEFANAGADAEVAWSALSEDHDLGGPENLARLIQDGIDRVKDDPNGVPPDRLERQIRGHVCSLYLLDRLLRKQNLAELYRRSGARLVVGIPFSTLAPLTARVLGQDVEVMTSLGSGYLASDAARHTDELKRPPEQTNPVHLTVSIEDDNIGLTPQFTAPALDVIVRAMRDHRVDGLWCRQWLISKLDPAIDFVSRACWDASLTPAAAYENLIDSICGREAVEPLLRAFALAEQITTENDACGNIHTFLTPNLLARYWDDKDVLKPSLLAMRPKYRELAELLVKARAAVSKPEGRRYIDQFIGQARFAEQWITCIEKLVDAARARRAADQARQAGDASEMDRQLHLCLNRVEQSLESCRSAVSEWAEAVRDRADLGALAALNFFGYRFLHCLRHLQFIRASQWSL